MQEKVQSIQTATSQNVQIGSLQPASLQMQQQQQQPDIQTIFSQMQHKTQSIQTARPQMQKEMKINSHMLLKINNSSDAPDAINLHTSEDVARFIEQNVLNKIDLFRLHNPAAIITQFYATYSRVCYFLFCFDIFFISLTLRLTKQ